MAYHQKKLGTFGLSDLFYFKNTRMMYLKNQVYNAVLKQHKTLNNPIQKHREARLAIAIAHISGFSESHKILHCHSKLCI